MAAIVAAARTPYLTETAWAVAAFWILASIGSFITVRVSARRGTLSILREELQRRSGYQGESGMKARASADAPESQRRALLARMAATRAELSASNHVVGMTGRISGGSSARHALMRLPSLGGSTGAAIAVVLAGFAVLGPRRLLATIVRAGLVSLIGRMARDVVAK
ncbi:hypothetical protein L0Z36_05955 [Burkholderia multivorans]|uniref:hypothetical protein n=1 Tax=Burkholderia multivorans TaxID=87883 RepID=UPI00201928A3|nr:hypothetical protein [Burkholderia multivorans]UQP01473.1 hypothetical protein L0Z36_05955 [Burkholderia multivorans]